MKKFILAFVVLAASALPVFAQGPVVPGTLLKSCNAVTGTGTCTIYALPLSNYNLPTAYSWSVVFNFGSASAVTVNLEGSIDGTNFYQLDQSTNTSGEFRSVVNKPAKFLRCNVTAYTLGTTSNLTCNIMFTAY